MLRIAGDKTIKWKPRANEKMGLQTMIDELYGTKLTEGWRQSSYDKYLRFESSDFYYEGLYNEHKELLGDIVEIFFPNLLFVPSKISDNTSQEFFMWCVFESILFIVWYQNMVKSKTQKGYKAVVEEMEEARYVLYKYVDNVKCLDNLITFPVQQNENIRNLEKFFVEHDRKHQIKKIIPKIKRHFGIDKLTVTKNEKILKSSKEIKALLQTPKLPKDVSLDDYLEEQYKRSKEMADRNNAQKQVKKEQEREQK
ncbi:MAG: hypothetical protein U9N49_09270 [Campylobacterota bacterium]|nr:hypothetical protein [Campylobacterota bacterium]